MNEPQDPQTAPPGRPTRPPGPERENPAPAATATPGTGHARLLTLLVLGEEGQAAAAWQMPAYTPLGLIRQIAELDEAGADLDPFTRHPARWQITDRSGDAAAFWGSVQDPEEAR